MVMMHFFNSCILWRNEHNVNGSKSASHGRAASLQTRETFLRKLEINLYDTRLVWHLCRENVLPDITRAMCGDKVIVSSVLSVPDYKTPATVIMRSTKWSASIVRNPRNVQAAGQWHRCKWVVYGDVRHLSEVNDAAD